jgi:2-aminoadipate transaminase
MELTLRRDSRDPLYQQVADQVQAAIRAGTLPPGYRLPPVRELAARYGLTRLTAHSAYAELQARGLVESHVGRGTFVANGAVAADAPPTGDRVPQWTGQGILADLLRMSEYPDLLSLAQAFPDPATYPLRDLRQCLQRAAADPAALDYGPMQGDAGLREELARLLLDRGMTVTPEQVLVTAGAQQGIDIALRALGEPGDVILVEEPTYPGVLEAASRRGLRLAGVPGDEQGIRVDALEMACRSYRPRLLYLVPTYGNPTGISLSAERREAVLRLAAAHRMLVLEDDVYGFLGYEFPVPPALKSLDRDERVVYLMSFSKLLVPALRLGAVVAPLELLPALGAAKHTADLVSSSLLQQALAEYLRRGHMAAHRRQATATYRPRRDAMLAALERYLQRCRWTRPAGGLSLWVRLPDGIVEAEFIADAMERGVGVAPGHAFFPQPQRQAHLRLSFGLHGPARIEDGIARLGRVLDEHLRRRSDVLARAGRITQPLV